MSGMHACLSLVSCVTPFCAHYVCTLFTLDALGPSGHRALLKHIASILINSIVLSSVWDCLQMGEQRQLSAQQHSLRRPFHHL